MNGNQNTKHNGDEAQENKMKMSIKNDWNL